MAVAAQAEVAAVAAATTAVQQGVRNHVVQHVAQILKLAWMELVVLMEQKHHVMETAANSVAVMVVARMKMFVLMEHVVLME